MEHDNKGQLVISDVWLNKELDIENIINLITKAIDISGMKIVHQTSNDFKPGNTIIWILSESHFSLHTYPEYNYISMDCYTCGASSKPIEAITYILDNLDVNKNTFKVIDRGVMDES